MDSKIEHPSHYNWMREAIGIEPIEICRLFGFERGNALKYLLRAGRKTEQGYNERQKTIEDLQKTKRYIDFELEYLKQNQ